MRTIDPKRMEEVISEEWKKQAREAHDAVAALHDDQKTDGIDNRSDVWRGLKDPMRDVMQGKCWYCESNQERSDNAVDHYRPKGRVAECPDMKCGYWWLAFVWQNYRYACTFCNSRRIDQEGGTEGGKQDHFPLYDERKRAKTEAADLDQEQPLLLDPCNEADPPLLWFDEDGQSVPNPRLCPDEECYFTNRVKTSIRLLHLDHVDLVERRKALCNRIRELTKQADRMFLKYQGGDMTARSAFAIAVRQLRDTLRDAEEYTATAYAMLMGLRATSATAAAALEAA